MRRYCALPGAGAAGASGVAGAAGAVGAAGASGVAGADGAAGGVAGPAGEAPETAFCSKIGLWRSRSKPTGMLRRWLKRSFKACNHKETVLVAWVGTTKRSMMRPSLYKT